MSKKIGRLETMERCECAGHSLLRQRRYDPSDPRGYFEFFELRLPDDRIVWPFRDSAGALLCDERMETPAKPLDQVIPADIARIFAAQIGAWKMSLVS